MRSRRRCLIVLLLALTSLPVRHLLAEGGAGVRFSWAFVHQGEDGTSKAIDYSQSIVKLHSGDRFRIYLKPQSACYAYLYLYDSQRQLFLFFPESFDFWKTGYQVDQLYSLPRADGWFYLDEHAGVEVFYLILSDRRLPELEADTAAYLEQKSKDGAERTLTRKYRVIDRIRTMLKDSSHLAGAVEKPVAVAGDFRGVGEEDIVHGVTVKAGSIYVRTIRLEH
jgi:hypothetical protein